MTITVEKIGDWKGINKKLNKIAKEGPVVFRKQTDLFAKKVQWKIIQAIKTQGAAVGQTWKANRPRTIAKKGNNFVLFWTGQYAASIQVKSDKVRRRSVYGKGTRGSVFEWEIAPKDVMHRTGKRTIPMLELAAHLEYGSTGWAGSHIPARPHWGPVHNWANRTMGRWIKSKYTKSRWLNKIWNER